MSTHLSRELLGAALILMVVQQVAILGALDAQNTVGYLPLIAVLLLLVWMFEHYLRVAVAEARDYWSGETEEVAEA